jgi:hypothetical protein
MSLHTAVQADGPTGSSAPGAAQRRWWSVITAAIVTVIFIEAVFAGAMLSGAPWAHAAHRATALALILATSVAGLSATLGLRRVSHGLRLGLMLLGLAAAIVVQTALGRATTHGANLLWVHVPLGVALVGLAAQAVASARRLGEA